MSHHPCPKCGSSDAFAEYDDGHFWCFSCRAYVPPKDMNIQHVEKHFTKTIKGVMPLPKDFTTDIPKEPYSWLKKYAITSEEISANNLGWSQSEQMLIFPYYGDANNVLCWQGRYFPSRSPKVCTRGFPDSHILLHNCGDRNSVRRVVVVEDAISAIKVSRVCDCSELLGSNLSLQKAVRLSKLYSHLTLWLDYDKLKEMIKLTEKYRSLFNNVNFIATELDPKEYSTEQIKEFLNYE